MSAHGPSGPVPRPRAADDRGRAAARRDPGADLLQGFLDVEAATQGLRRHRGLSPDEARRWLRAQAQGAGLSVAEVARRVVEDLGRPARVVGGEGPPTPTL